MFTGGSLLLGRVGADASAIGHERRTDHAVTTDDEDAFVEELLAGLSAYPAHYAHAGPLNRSGPRRSTSPTPRRSTPPGSGSSSPT